MEKKRNLWVIPTDKPSRLYLGNNRNFVFGMMQTSIQSRNDDFTNQHIYITSDEEIKEGDAVIHDFGMGYELENPCDSDNLKSNTRSKIILTTDQDLIEDGVQAIDNDFLEWFVNNPSCEYVDVKKLYKNGYGNWYKNDSHFIPSETKYKIIIPQEEPKQETLEEAAEKYANKKGDIPTTKLEDAIFKQGFIDGAKWQAEKMYSEEDMISFATFYYTHQGKTTEYWGKDLFKIWFEQFKKR